MRLRWFSSILIFLSAYSPLSVIFLIQDIDFTTGIIAHPKIVYSLLGVSVFSLLFIAIAVRSVRTSTPPVIVLSVSNRSGELINYSIPYMLSFFVMDLSNVNLLVSFAFFMFIMYWMTLKTHNIFVNPVLAMMGYNIYDVHYKRDGHEFEDFFLVKGDRLRRNEPCRVVELSENLLLVTERIPRQ